MDVREADLYGGERSCTSLKVLSLYMDKLATTDEGILVHAVQDYSYIGRLKPGLSHAYPYILIEDTQRIDMNISENVQVKLWNFTE